MEGHRSELCARLELRLTDGRAADALHKLWSPFGSRRPRRCHSTYLILNINTDYVLTSEPKFVPVDTHAHKLWLTKPHRLCGSEHEAGRPGALLSAPDARRGRLHSSPTYLNRAMSAFAPAVEEAGF